MVILGKGPLLSMGHVRTPMRTDRTQAPQGHQDHVHRAKCSEATKGRRHSASTTLPALSPRPAPYCSFHALHQTQSLCVSHTGREGRRGVSPAVPKAKCVLPLGSKHELLCATGPGRPSEGVWAGKDVGVWMFFWGLSQTIPRRTGRPWGWN